MASLRDKHSNRQDDREKRRQDGSKEGMQVEKKMGGRRDERDVLIMTMKIVISVGLI